MMIFTVGISTVESDFFIGLVGRERATSYLVTTTLRVALTALACFIGAFDIGFVDFLNLTGSILGVFLTFVFPVAPELTRSYSSSGTSRGLAGSLFIISMVFIP